jgi:hypothetical protein
MTFLNPLSPNSHTLSCIFIEEIENYETRNIVKNVHVKLTLEFFTCFCKNTWPPMTIWAYWIKKKSKLLFSRRNAAEKIIFWAAI